MPSRRQEGYRRFERRRCTGHARWRLQQLVTILFQGYPQELTSRAHAGFVEQLLHGSFRSTLGNIELRCKVRPAASIGTGKIIRMVSQDVAYRVASVSINILCISTLIT